MFYGLNKLEDMLLAKDIKNYIDACIVSQNDLLRRYDAELRSLCKSFYNLEKKFSLVQKKLERNNQAIRNLNLRIDVLNEKIKFLEERLGHKKDNDSFPPCMC